MAGEYALRGARISEECDLVRILNGVKEGVMTENEAKIFIQNAMEQSKKTLAELLLISPKVFAVRKKSLGEYYSNLENCKKEIQSCEVAIQALEEVQRWRTSVINPKIKNVFANTSTQICHNCDHKDEYIEELEAEVEEYRTIGTPEECRAAVEKQTAKKMESPWCPCCGKFLTTEYMNKRYHCIYCGQLLDWGDEE